MKLVRCFILNAGILFAGIANAATGERLLGIWTGSEKGYENNIYTDSVVEYAIVQAKDNSAIGYKLEKKQGAANWEKVSSVSATVTSNSVVSTFEQGPASEGRLTNNRLELRLDDSATNGELLVRAIRDKNLQSFEVKWPVLPERIDVAKASEFQKAQYYNEIINSLKAVKELQNQLDNISSYNGKISQAQAERMQASLQNLRSIFDGITETLQAIANNLLREIESLK